MDRLLFIALALSADAAAGLAGGLLSERWLKRHLGPLVGFAAGALVCAAFLDILPEASAKLGTAAFAWALGAFALSAMLEWRLDHHGGEAVRPVKLMPLSLLASDALHNTGDGAAVAAAFLASPRAGFAAAAAVVIHELPQEVGDYALLRASGWSRGKALLALFGVQLTAFAGAGAVLLAARHAHLAASVAVAIAAGTFLYIGATDLLPELGRGTAPERRRRRAGFLLGLVGMALMTVWLD